MNAKETFSHLRKLARAKRDQDIKFAKTAYELRLKQIVQLERDLSSVDPTFVSRPRRTVNSTKDTIDLAAPKNEIFTFDELVRLVEASTDHPPRTNNLRNTLRIMVKAADRFKEVINPESRLIKRYARLHVDAAEPLPPLAQIVIEALDQANAPMRPIEICVWLVEQNRPIDGDPSAAVGQVLRTLRKYPARFKEADEGYWRLLKGNRL